MPSTLSIEDPGKQALLFGRSITDAALVNRTHLDRRTELLGFAFHLHPTVTFAVDPAPYDDALELINEVFRDCRSGGWDGYDAAPIGYGTYRKGLELLDALPSHMPYPEVVPEPDGDLAFEWTGRHGLKLSVSLAASGRMTILFMPFRIRTTMYWTTPELPKPLLAWIELFA